MKHDGARLTLVVSLFLVLISFIILSCAKVTVPTTTFSSLAVTTAPPKFVSKSYMVENRSSVAFDGYAKVILPFSKGEFYEKGWQEAQTKAAVLLRPIKWYIEGGQKSSVALAEAIFPISLPPNAKVVGKVYTGDPVKDDLAPFMFGKNLFNLAATGMLQQSFIAVMKIGGGYCTSSIQGAAKVIMSNNYATVFRFRDYFRCGGVVNASASATYYVTVYNNRDFGEITFVAGNDNVEAARGDLQFQELSILTMAPFDIEVLNRPAFAVGAPDTLLGFKRNTLMGVGNLIDGQTVAYKMKFIVRGNRTDEASFAATLSSPLGEILGVAGPDHWKNSEALGVNGFIPTPNFPSLTAGFNALNHHCTDTVQASDIYQNMGLINLNPPSTGAQPDFMAASPVFAQQVVQTQNACPLRRAFPSIYREALRPQQYWYQDGPARQETWPELFFWSSRPHYDWSWNSGKGADIWRNRTTAGTPPINVGYAHNWGTMDEEHMGNNHLRAFYELTADPYIGDKVEYYATIQAWDYYTGNASVGGRGRLNAPGAERAVGRSGKEALALAQFSPDSPASLFLLDRDAYKLGNAIKNLGDQTSANYHFTSMGTMQDARIGPSLACMQGAFEPQLPRTGDCSAPMLWQIGFTMEKLYQNWSKGVNRPVAEYLLDRYLNAVPLYFDANGVPYTYFLAKDPTLGRTQGGIGLEWWAGWLLAAKARPNHPQSSFINNQVKGVVSAAWRNGSIQDQYWYTNEIWKVIN